MFGFIITGKSETDHNEIAVALKDYARDIITIDTIPGKLVLVEGSESVIQKFAKENDLIATPEKEFRLNGRGFSRRGYPGASAPNPLSEEQDNRLFLTQFDN